MKLSKSARVIVRDILIIACAIACVIYGNALFDGMVNSVRQEIKFAIAKEYQKSFSTTDFPPTQKQALNYAETILNNWEKSDAYKIDAKYPRLISVSLEAGVYQFLLRLLASALAAVAIAFNHRKNIWFKYTIDNGRIKWVEATLKMIFVILIIDLVLMIINVIFPTVRIASSPYFTSILMFSFVVAIFTPYFQSRHIIKTGGFIFA